MPAAYMTEAQFQLQQKMRERGIGPVTIMSNRVPQPLDSILSQSLTTTQTMTRQRSELPWIIGVDPGKNGGVVIRSVVDRSMSLRSPVEQHRMPATLDGVINLFGQLAEVCPTQINERPSFCGIHYHVLPKKAIVYVEHLQPFPLGSRKSIWTLAEGYGQLLAVIRNAGFSAKRVRPQEWQTTLNVRCGGDKKKLWDFAKSIFPEVSFECADAFLISEYGICDLAAQELSGQSFISEYYLSG